MSEKEGCYECVSTGRQVWYLFQLHFTPKPMLSFYLLYNLSHCFSSWYCHINFGSIACDLLSTSIHLFTNTCLGRWHELFCSDFDLDYYKLNIFHYSHLATSPVHHCFPKYTSLYTSRDIHTSTSTQCYLYTRAATHRSQSLSLMLITSPLHYKLLHCTGLYYKVLDNNLPHCLGLTYKVLGYTLILNPGLYYKILNYKLLHCPGLTYTVLDYNLPHCPELTYKVLDYYLPHCPGLTYKVLDYNLPHCPDLTYKVLDYNLPHSPGLIYKFLDYNLPH